MTIKQQTDLCAIQKVCQLHNGIFHLISPVPHFVNFAVSLPRVIH